MESGPRTGKPTCTFQINRLRDSKAGTKTDGDFGTNPCPYRCRIGRGPTRGRTLLQCADNPIAWADLSCRKSARINKPTRPKTKPGPGRCPSKVRGQIGGSQ